jgi:glycosyltransferase involved in cell wall biosynthesis
VPSALTTGAARRETTIDVPQISVILPAHNRANCIGRAVDSVLAQRFADFELIVVDDGSTDATLAVVREYDDARLKVIALKRNCGSNAARNAGIRAARAPLVAFLDSDDAYLPNKLGVVVAEFARRPELGVLVDSYLVQFPDDRPDQQRVNAVIEGDAFVEALFQRRLWKATPAISARRDAVLLAGLFDEELGRRQDFEFLARAARVTHCAASDQLLWVKSWSPVAISSQPGTFINATIALCRRNPEYVADPRFYDGLARDVARQMSRLIRAGRWRDAARDVRLLRREFGAARTLRLLRHGWREANVRKRAKQNAA